MTGEKRAEYTHATTTQCYNPSNGCWDEEILSAIDVPFDLFPSIVYPGEVLGTIGDINVSIPSCHDTGSAVVAVPSTDNVYCYLSSGTWSLMGTETKKPVITDEVYKQNFTNEGGVEGTNRLLKNLPGLWFEQELMREWTSKGSLVRHEDLYQLASGVQAFRSVINPADARFLPPGDMTPRIAEYCRDHGETVPVSMGEHIRCVYDSLALSYLKCLGELESLMGESYPVIHVIGGGSLNRFLNQLTADITRRKLVAGPVEAAALGNSIMQYRCIGLLDSIGEARRILGETLDLVEYYPESGLEWENAYSRYQSLITQ